MLYFGLPRLAGLEDTGGRLSSGDPLWLCAAVLLEVAAYAAYVFTFHRLFAEPGSRIGWRESYDISLAGVVATRVFAAAGAGGVALTVWALDRSGMDRRLLVTRLTSFYVLIYGIFMGALSSSARRCERACWTVLPRSASPSCPRSSAASSSSRGWRQPGSCPRSGGAWPSAAVVTSESRSGWRRWPARPSSWRRACAARWISCAAATRQSSAPSAGGPSTWPSC